MLRLKDRTALLTLFFFFLFPAFGCSPVNIGPGLNTSPWKVGVIISSPSPDTTVSGDVSVQVIVNDSTPNTKVSNMFLYIDGNMQVNSIYDNPPPFDWNTTDVKDGSHTLQIQAEICENNSNSNNCNFFWSKPITVNVNNAPVWQGSVSITSPATNAKMSGTDTIKFHVINNTPNSFLAGEFLLLNGSVGVSNGTTINDSTALFYATNFANGTYSLSVSAHVIADDGIHTHDFVSSPISVVVAN